MRLKINMNLTASTTAMEILQHVTRAVRLLPEPLRPMVDCVPCGDGWALIERDYHEPRRNMNGVEKRTTEEWTKGGTTIRRSIQDNGCFYINAPLLPTAEQLANLRDVCNAVLAEHGVHMSPTTPKKEYCGACDGTGKIEGFPGDCQRCNGTGIAPAVPEVESSDKAFGLPRRAS